MRHTFPLLFMENAFPVRDNIFIVPPLVSKPTAETDATSRRLTDILCTRCGLCCDGSLFADVELAGPRETSGLELLGLDVEDADKGEGALLSLPCRALKGKRCSIYPHRPECCRTFECRLLQQAKTGDISVAIDGRIERRLSSDDLRNRLRTLVTMRKSNRQIGARSYDF